MARRVDTGERARDEPVDRAVGAGVAPPRARGDGARAHVMRSASSSAVGWWPDRTTFTNTARPAPVGSSTRQVHEIPGHSHAIVQVHAAYSERTGSGGPSDTPPTIRRVTEPSGQAVGSERRDRARADAVVDATTDRARTARGHRHRRGLLLRAAQGDRRVLRVPADLDRRVRVDRGRARVRGDQLLHGVDAAAARHAHDAVARDRRRRSSRRTRSARSCPRARRPAPRCRCGC